MKKTITTFALLCCSGPLLAQDKNVKEHVSTGDTNDLGIFLLKIDTSSVLWGVVGVIAVAIVGYLVYRFFKNTEEKKADLVPVIKNVSPNPSKGPITIEVQGHASQLKILNMSGQSLGSFAVAGGGEIHFDLSSMPRGKYLAVAFYGGTESNAVQFTLQ